MPSPKVYLDTNVFISALEQDGARSDHAWWILEAVERGSIAGATSELTLAEVLVKPIERRADDLVSAYQGMIAPGPHFDVLPVRRDVLVAAAAIRAGRSSVRLPDAVHVASAVVMGCSFFVSEDRRVNAPEGIRLVRLDSFTLDEIAQQ